MERERGRGLKKSPHFVSFCYPSCRLGAVPHGVFFSPSFYNASPFPCDPPTVQTWDCHHRLSSLDLQGPRALPTSQTKRYTKILQRGSLLQSLENTAQEKREYGTEKSGPNDCRPIKSATVVPGQYPSSCVLFKTHNVSESGFCSGEEGVDPVSAASR
jgi:hypothetical protein